MAREEERDVSRQAGQDCRRRDRDERAIRQGDGGARARGQTDAKLRERGLDKLSAFGAMKAEGEANVRAMIDELIAGDVLTVTAGTIRCSKRAHTRGMCCAGICPSAWRCCLRMPRRNSSAA